MGICALRSHAKIKSILRKLKYWRHQNDLPFLKRNTNITPNETSDLVAMQNKKTAAKAEMSLVSEVVMTYVTFRACINISNLFVFLLGALVMPQISFSLLKFENVLFTAKLKSSIIL